MDGSRLCLFECLYHVRRALAYFQLFLISLVIVEDVGCRLGSILLQLQLSPLHLEETLDRVFSPGVAEAAMVSLCKGDFDLDEDVDDSDLAAFAGDFGRTDCAGDCTGNFDGDGDVDGLDLTVFRANFGRSDCEVVPADPATEAPEPDRTVASNLTSSTAFLYQGEEPVQTGVANGTIKAKRVSLLKGQVKGPDGSPLPGVTVNVLDHPELGRTLSRADGGLDLAVNGGGTLTVEYSKDGYMSLQRTVQADWHGYEQLPDVVMTRRASKVTSVDLEAGQLQVASGSRVSDKDGSRQAAVFIPQGTQAEIYLPDGSTQAVDSLNMRITEFTEGDSGPEAMPAELPPNTGYTYALELTAEEATTKIQGKDVLFNKPVYTYAENFLGFPVGGAVPVGFYDDDAAAWVPAENGRVIEIVGKSDGLAAIDVNGSGSPADAQTLDDLGFTVAERQRLADRYSVGQSLWRIPMHHLSVWDANWGWGPPLDAEPPDLDIIEWLSDVLRDDCNPCEQAGSVIECQNQVLGEDLPIPGTNLRLHYAGDRVPGQIGRAHV